MGQALLEQQQAEEMKEKVKDYQLHQLASQNDTDVRTERAIQPTRKHTTSIYTVEANRIK